MQRYTFFQKQSVFRGKKCVLDCYFSGDVCAEDERINISLRHQGHSSLPVAITWNLSQIVGQGETKLFFLSKFEIL